VYNGIRKVEKEMLDKHDVERILKVSPGTVNNMMRRGELPYVKIGKVVRFREEDIDRIINGERNTE